LRATATDSPGDYLHSALQSGSNKWPLWKESVESRSNLNRNGAQSAMRHFFFAAALFALAARLTIYAEAGTTSNLISFAVFWVCAAGYAVYLIVD
jgi:hypothetical protein